jgi:hypothetical protein
MMIESAIRRRVRVVRATAVVISVAAAVVHQGVAGNWFGLALAVMAGALLLFHSPVRTNRRSGTVSLSFIALGVLLVWGFREQLVWLSLAGSLSLVGAADFDRLLLRFPANSPLASQRIVFQRHLLTLLIIGIVSAISTLSVIAVTLELQLAAVLLLSLFGVLTLAGVIRSLQADDSQE